MNIRVLKKAFGLLIVDLVIIIGIFVLQFRTDSSIIEKIGNLQFTFSQSEDENKVVTVKNKLNITYNGINFFCDDQHPAVVMDYGNNTKPVKFIGWEKSDDLSYKLSFTENVSVLFELASNEPYASLAIITDFPNDVASFAIPYNYASNMKVQKDDGNRVILNGRKNSWEVSAHSLSSGYFGTNARDFVATYAVHDETQKFTFDSITELAIADKSVFDTNLTTFRNSLISSFKANTAEANLTEQVVVSYIAAQAENGNYINAIDEIPSEIKKSKQRTYLSAPYLNTLEEMNAILEKTIKENEKKITDASNANSLDIFTIHGIADFMCVHSNPEIVKKLLQGASYVDESALSIAQAAGILQVFANLSNLNADYAKLLVPSLENCVEKITEACNYDGNVLTISENDTFLSVIQAIETGVALLRYGELVNNPTLQKAGYVLINSYLTESASFDLRTLANLYPIISYNNWYYPHFEKIRTADDSMMWAWTCAKSITSQKDADGSMTITIDFPENYTHYVIVKGIPQFSTIYIYNMAFRTDPRFETYNSSGYVYKQNTQTLLLKSRHKSKLEKVRFEYDGLSESDVSSSKTVVEIKPVQEESNSETVTSDSGVEITAPAPATPSVETTAAPAPAEEEAPAETETSSEEAVTTTEETSLETEETPVEEETNGKKKKKRKNR